MAVPRAVWIAASNELARMRVPGFPAALLREVRPTIFLSVKDPGGHFRGSAGSSFSGSSNRRTPAGYPPVTLYWLSQQRTAESDASVDGKPPVYLNFALVSERNSRDVPHPSDSICLSCEKNCPDCEAERIAYLAEFARLPLKEVEPTVRPRLMLDFESPQQIDAEIRTAIAAQQAGMKKLVKQLEGLGLIERSPDLGAAPFAIHIDDQRKDRSVPLPQYLIDYRP